MNRARPAPLKFPCVFPIKAIGHNAAGFEAQVAEIVGHHVPDLPADAVTTRASGGGKYRAVTVIITATSQAQLDAVYRELQSLEQVLMLL